MNHPKRSKAYLQRSKAYPRNPRLRDWVSKIFNGGRTARNSPRLPKRSNGVVTARIKAALLMAVGLLFLGLLAKAGIGPPPPPPKTKTALIVVDRTDPLEERHLDLIAADLRQVVMELPTGIAVHLISIGAEREMGPAKATTLFSETKISDGSDANPWTDTRAYLKKKYDEKFSEPLESAIAAAVDPNVPEAESSPLLEMLFNPSLTRPH